MSALISTEELAARQSSLRIIDASWHMPAEGRSAVSEYTAGHIPGAVFFDLDKVVDRTSPYPHMLPAPVDFAAAMEALGIGDKEDVVVYDSAGLFSAARLWWMLRVFGHDRVRVLDGGLLKWRAENRALDNAPPLSRKTAFIPRFRPKLVRQRGQVQENLVTRRECLIDARSPARFTGDEPDPRPGVASGHIPGSINLHYKECLTPPLQTLKSPHELRRLFQDKGLNPSQPLIASCGSGVTACILALVLYELGNHDVPVYDGSWAEWGSQPVKRP